MITKNEYKLLKYFYEKPVPFSVFEEYIGNDDSKKISFYSLIKSKYVTVDCGDSILSSDLIHLTDDGKIAYMHYKDGKASRIKSWIFTTFFGGVITGVVTTLLSELILYLCAKLIGLL